MTSILQGARPPGLVSRFELEARERARALVSEAEEAAARIRSAVDAEREEALRRAAEAGREEGRAGVAAALLEVGEARRSRLEGLEAEIATAALEVARALVGRAVAEHPECVVELARLALEPVRARREVIVRVHPADAPRLRDEQPRLEALLSRAPGIALREDPGIGRGEVVVETEAGRVDGRVEARLALLERAIGGRR